jgi:GNAT superfamily N-acetyltransferase
MIAIRLNDLKQYSDVLLSRGGKPFTVRFAEPGDAEALQAYFRGLSVRSRYNRFFGAMSELPAALLGHFTHPGEDERFSIIAMMQVERIETIVGEARYEFDPVTSRFEFGLSVDDRFQGQGIGQALMSNLECRASAFGAETIFGDTLRSNDAMMAAARKAGYRFVASPGDWKLIRFEKHLDVAPQDIPCASWRLAAEQAVHAAA